MSDLDDFLKLTLDGTSSNASAAAAGLQSTQRPTKAGLNWLTATPSQRSMDLLFELQGGTVLRCLRLMGSNEGGPFVEQTAMTLRQPAISLTCSADGRMVAFACTDGSIQCFNVTSQIFNHRWTIKDAHSHVTPSAALPASSIRDDAASAAGPIHTFSFVPRDGDYTLLLVDSGTGSISIFDAALAKPKDMLQLHSANFPLPKAKSASWLMPKDGSGASDTLDIIIGTHSDSIQVYSYNIDGTFNKTGDVPEPKIEDDDYGEEIDIPWTCVHMDSSDGTVVLGMCRVVPDEYAVEDDEEEEDDSAEHQVHLFVADVTSDGAAPSVSAWKHLGDVVPFFSVPKGGRHAFFSSFTTVNDLQLIAVAANVGSDISIVAKSSAGGDGWTLVEFQEGHQATTPTDDDDEFSFPVGLCLVPHHDGKLRLVVASTDGVLSSFSLEHEGNPALSQLASAVETALPDEFVPMKAFQKPTTQTTPFGGAGIATKSTLGFGAAGSTTTSLFGNSVTPASFSFQPSSLTAGSAAPKDSSKTSTSGFSFGASGGAAFGSPSALGGGSAFGSATPFGTPSKPLGQTTPLGSTFGSSTPSATFGSASAGSSLGFGALASTSGGNTGFGAFAATPKKETIDKPPATPASDKPKQATETTSSSAFGSGDGSNMVFGSGSTPPTFNFGKASTTSLFGALGTTKTTQQSPFQSAFGNKPSQLNQGMVKPLFGTKQPDTPKDEPKTVQTKSTEVNIPPNAIPANNIFNEFDTDKTGIIPIDKIEDMIDALGEGFSGDEFDEQVALIDPNKTGNVTRDAFISWYSKLLDGGVKKSGDDDDADSLDSDERAEREEERQSASAAFTEMAGSDGKVGFSEFPKLFKALGSTYGEEEFRKPMKKLRESASGSDRIDKEPFLDWYVNWLFAGDESDDDDDDDDDVTGGGGEAPETATSGGSGAVSGWGDTFKLDKDSWKCDVCSVRNSGTATECAACETVRPGSKKANKESKAKESGSSSSGIGQSGFSFGGASSGGGAIGSGGFSFGALSATSAASSKVPPPPPPPPSSSLFGGGGGAGSAGDGKSKMSFGFGSGASSGGGFSFGAAPASASDGKSIFGASTGFSFGGASSTTPVKETKSIVAPTPPSTIPPNAIPANNIFNEFDTNKTGIIPIDKIEDMIDALGEGFSGDEFDEQVALIDPNKTGNVTRDAFISWYSKLLDGGAKKSGDDDDADSLDSDERAEREEERQSASAAFTEMAGSDGKVGFSEFPKLFKALGSTYGEEEFRKPMKKLRGSASGSDRIDKEPFLDWYVNWLFAGDESDDDDDDDDGTGGGGEAPETATSGGSGAVSGWGDTFKLDKDSWKCDVCSVRNSGTATECAACETVRPGSKKANKESKAKESGSSSSGIGQSGFSFGGASSGGGAIGSGGFSFGALSATSAASSKVPPPPPPPPSSSLFGGGGGAGSAGDGKSKMSFGFGSGTSSGGGFSFGATALAPPSAVPSNDKSALGGSAAFPPMASKAPTPFDAAAPKPKPNSGSSAFPPMASKAPTPFGGSASKPKPSGGSSAAFPPMASKAPTPFGAAASKPKPSGSSSAAFPPLSSKAPTPFGAIASKPKPSGSSTAFPPMASKAPTPFGATAPKPKPSGSSAAFPPMASKAPTPFGATASKPKPSGSSSAAFPPLSSKAPTPFGAAAPKPKSSGSSSAAFPPMASKAPTPFGATVSKPKPSGSSSAAFPPMASKAPTPFGATASKPKPSGSSSAAFPPLSSKAPTPFGAAAPKPKPSGSSSAAFPPMASKAPTPFGAAAAKPKPSGSSSAFPPMSSKAPTPFGATANKSQPSGGSSSAFPPMSTKAPTPFGAGANKPKSSGSSSSAFPPISAKAPTPFGGSSTAFSAKPASTGPSPFAAFSAKPPSSSSGAASGSSSVASNTLPFGATTSATDPNAPSASGASTFGVATGKPVTSAAQSSASPMAQTSQQKGGSAKPHAAPLSTKNLSDAAVEFQAVADNFKKHIAKVSSMVQEVSLDQAMQEKVNQHVNEIQSIRTSCIDLDKSLLEFRKQNAFILARKTDASRQAAEARRLLEKAANADVRNGEDSIAKSEPLDMASEARRRLFACQAMQVKTKSDTLRQRLDMVESMRTSAPEGRIAVLKGVMITNKKVQSFGKMVNRIEAKAQNVSKLLPTTARGQRQSRSIAYGRSTTTYGLASPTFVRRKKIQQPRMPALFSPQKKPSRAKQESSVGQWKHAESIVQRLGQGAATIVRIDDLKPVIDGQSSAKRRQKTATMASIAPSTPTFSSPSPQLSALTPSSFDQRNTGGGSQQVFMFSPPSARKLRSGWDHPVQNELDQARRLNFAFSQDLKESTVNDVSKDALASFGTTPERVSAANKVVKTGVRTPPKPPVQSKPPVAAPQAAKKAAQAPAASSAAFPPLSTKAPSNPFSKKTSSSAPSKPDSKPATASASASSSYPPVSGVAPKSFKELTSKPSNDAKREGASSLFSNPSSGSKAKASDEEQASAVAPKPPSSAAPAFSAMSTMGSLGLSLGVGSSSSSAAPGIAPKDDFKALLTSFYQNHNPSKVGEVDKTLQKYMGREKEMFAKLAAKYKTTSPLDAGAGSVTGAAGAPPAASNPQSSGVSAFPSTSASQGAASSGFGSAFSSSAPSSAPSPFALSGSSKPGTTPFGTASAAAPFGQPQQQQSAPKPATAAAPAGGGFSAFSGATNSMTTNASPFLPAQTSNTMASASPFGSAPASATPFGQPAQQPGAFGAPTGAQSQAKFNGLTAREMLVKFYNEKNPTKVAEVDKLLAKYVGKEEQLFRNLAKKYQLDPSVFGVSSSAAPPAGGFGMAAAAAPNAFGSPSNLGSNAVFGQSPGFGQPPPQAQPSQGSAFGSSTPFGSTTTSGFGSLAQSSGAATFGSSAAGGAPGFSSQGAPSGFGAFGSPTPGGFGSAAASPFGSARR